MATINTTQSQRPRSTEQFELLPTGMYRVEIKRASLEPNTYGEQLPDGSYPDQLVLLFEVFSATEDQDEGVVGLAVWARMEPWYGVTKKGASKFKLLIDALLAQQSITWDPENFDTDDLIGQKLRAMVELYKKTMGPNIGQDGNKVTAFATLKPQKPVKAAPAAPAPAAKPAAAPARRNVPVAVAEEGDEDADGLF